MTKTVEIEDHVMLALSALRRGEYPRALDSLALAFAKTKTVHDARMNPGPRRVPSGELLRE